MPKILLLRVAQDLSGSLVSELSRAGYDVAAPESADVRTVLQQQPDLILLQTDVRTLDCCGLLTQLKGDETTAPVKIILLADGGSLERSHALDLGADDVLSIPFDRGELFARIRAQLREKAPDDRLRLEVLDARKKEHEAEEALAAIVAQKETGKRRWIALGVVAVGNDTEGLVQELGRRKLIRPLVTQGHLGLEFRRTHLKGRQHDGKAKICANTSLTGRHSHERACL